MAIILHNLNRNTMDERKGIDELYLKMPESLYRGYPNLILYVTIYLHSQ